MLRSLDIRDMLLIDRLELEFAPGLNVLTGETGAGKSILLDCLGFVLGWRGRADLVRHGADQGEVTAVFDLPDAHPARAILQDAGIEVDDDELILRRINGGDGRKTGFVNDRRVSGEVLRHLSAVLVELHGQHDDRGLLNPRGHRLLLDDFAGLDLSGIRAAWVARRKAREDLTAAEAQLAKARAEEDFLRHAVAELDDLAPVAGEEAELDIRRRGMQAAERIREDVAKALQMLGGAGAEGAMLDASRWLEGAADRAEGRLDAPIAALSRALIELGERLISALTLALAAAVVLVVVNTIRLAIESRREEIVVVKIVGGTDGFVRRPFLYTGFCFGFAGGLTAVILVQTALWWLGGPIDELLALYNSEESLTSMAASNLIVLPLFSGILGLLGAWLAVGRHLGEIEPNF